MIKITFQPLQISIGALQEKKPTIDVLYISTLAQKDFLISLLDMVNLEIKIAYLT